MWSTDEATCENLDSKNLVVRIESLNKAAEISGER